jgi:hypothetical protein
VNHFTSSRFWQCYNNLPNEVRAAADKQYALLKENPWHPSLHFKKVGKYWSARVNAGIRTLAVESGGDYIWFWIGDHREYERLIKSG